MGMPITDECLNRSANPTKSHLNLHIHECSSDNLLLYNKTTKEDYQKAIFVLTHNNFCYNARVTFGIFPDRHYFSGH